MVESSFPWDSTVTGDATTAPYSASEYAQFVRTRTDVEAVIRDLTPTMTDPRTLLVLEPLRWALALTPSWLAWEQVPGVLPLWEACAAIHSVCGVVVRRVFDRKLKHDLAPV